MHENATDLRVQREHRARSLIFYEFSPLLRQKGHDGTREGSRGEEGLCDRTPVSRPEALAGRASGCRRPALPRPLSAPPRVLREQGAACGQAGQTDLGRYGVRSSKRQESMLLGGAACLCPFIQTLSPKAQLFTVPPLLPVGASPPCEVSPVGTPLL